MKKILQKILSVPAELDNIRTSLSRLNDNVEVFILGYLNKKQFEDEHFVAVHIECIVKERIAKRRDYGSDSQFELDPEKIEYMRRGSIGYSAMITGPHTFRIQPNQPIKDLRITVFCDLSKVIVKSIQCANQNVMAADDGSGACPIAYFDGTLNPANIMYIVVDKR